MEEVKKSLHRHRSAPEVVSSCCSAATALEDFFLSDGKVSVGSVWAINKYVMYFRCLLRRGFCCLGYVGGSREDVLSPRGSAVFRSLDLAYNH